MAYIMNHEMLLLKASSLLKIKCSNHMHLKLPFLVILSSSALNFLSGSTKKSSILQMGWSFSQEKHSSSGSLSTLSCACTSDHEWCRALVLFFSRTLLFAGARVWFPVAAQISLGMLKNLRSDAAARSFVATHMRRNTQTHRGASGKRSKAPPSEAMNSMPPTHASVPTFGYNSAEAQQRHAHPP